MPRQARLDAPGVLHHIMIRGIERRKIFINDILPETQTGCYAWLFIPNHARFLFRTGLAPLAIVCQEDAYLKELVRYIYLNPVRAGIVAGPKESNRCPYCGHSALMGRKRRPWQDSERKESFLHLWHRELALKEL